MSLGRCVPQGTRQASTCSCNHRSSGRASHSLSCRARSLEPRKWKCEVDGNWIKSVSRHPSGSHVCRYSDCTKDAIPARPLLSVRAACRKDIPHLAEIERLSHGYWNEQELGDELRLEYSVLLVAELQAHGGSVLVGLVLMWCIADEVQVIELAVHPKFQRQGIGLALMTKALNVGTRMVKGRAGRGVAVLEVGKDNAAALSLYRKLGFQESFTRKGYYPDGSDAYSMRLRIN